MFPFIFLFRKGKKIKKDNKDTIYIFFVVDTLVVSFLFFLLNFTFFCCCNFSLFSFPFLPGKEIRDKKEKVKKKMEVEREMKMRDVKTF